MKALAVEAAHNQVRSGQTGFESPWRHTAAGALYHGVELCQQLNQDVKRNPRILDLGKERDNI